MGTNRPRFSVTMSEEMYEQINDFQHRNKFPTQTKAIAQILQLGIEALSNGAEEKILADKLFNEGMELYNSLDEIDKAEIRGEMKQMLKADKYRKND